MPKKIDKYLVVWMTKTMDEENREVFKDGYQVFVDGTTKENLRLATEKYNELKDHDETYTTNLCKIIESTDY